MVEALRTALATISPEAGQRWPPTQGTSVAAAAGTRPLVPGVRSERPDPSVERYLLFETVAELLHGEASRHPFADRPRRRALGRRAVAEVIEHVIRHELTSRTMVVAMARVPADDPTPELDRVATISPGRAADAGRRRPLATSEVVSLLEVYGRDGSDAVELRAATGGNAFFLTESSVTRRPARRRPARLGAGHARRPPRSPRPRRQPGPQLTAVAGQAATLRCSLRPAASTAIGCSTPTDHASPPACWSGRRRPPGAPPRPHRSGHPRAARADPPARPPPPPRRGPRAGQRAQRVAGPPRPPPDGGGRLIDRAAASRPGWPPASIRCRSALEDAAAWAGASTSC